MALSSIMEVRERARLGVTLAFVAAGLAVAGCSEGPTEANDDDEDAGSGGSGAAETSGGVGGSGVGGSGVGGSAAGGAGGKAGNGGAGGTSGNGGTDGGSAGAGGTETIPFCQMPCETPADCTTNTALPYDADNHACTNGVCVYLGCHTDAECESVAAGYQCFDAGSGTPGCAPRCQSVAECAQDSPAYDLDNYICQNGGCLYTGCNSNAECDSLRAGLTCRDAGAGLTLCLIACVAAADCASTVPYADLDNVECRDGVCYNTGCNSDAECESIGAVCR